MIQSEQVKNFFSYALLESAIRFSSHANENEKEFSIIRPRLLELQEAEYDSLNANLRDELCILVEKKLELNDRHRSNIIASVMCIVSYLEARINELIDDFPNIHYEKDACISSIMKYYREKIFQENNRDNILNKYAEVLKIINNKKLDTGKSPYQDVNILIKCRNNLVHFKPAIIAEYIDGTWVWKDIEIARKLKGKFDLNPFAIDQYEYFPDLYISYSFTEWAIRSSLLFIREIFALIQVDDDVSEAVCGKMKRLFT